MKNVYPFMLLLVATLLGACKKEEYGDELVKSKDYYIAFKRASDNNYQYVVTTDSWTGYRTATTLTVRGGKVVGRSYVAELGQWADTAWVLPVVKEWVEDAGSLGTHEEGAALRNLDDVYEQARKEWLKKRDDAYVYFEAKNNGMISTAGYSNKNCADDCFVGIAIRSITRL